MHWLLFNSKMFFALLLLCLSLSDTVFTQTCSHGSARVVSCIKTFRLHASFMLSSPHHCTMELLRSAWIILGVVFALTSGITMMQVWSVNNWDTLLMVYYWYVYIICYMLKLPISYRCNRIFYCLLLLICHFAQHFWFKLYW